MRRAKSNKQASKSQWKAIGNRCGDQSVPITQTVMEESSRLRREAIRLRRAQNVEVVRDVCFVASMCVVFENS